MDWLMYLRDYVFQNHPVLYTIVVIAIGILILRYVYKHEQKLNKEYLSKPYNPFRTDNEK